VTGDHAQSSPAARDAVTGRSCGLARTAVASLQPGETVLDLGSVGGIDVLLSARRVGPDGIAYGLYASPDVLALARASAAQAGVGNARFLQRRIEGIPLPGAPVDAVISSCVINLSADRPRVLAEAFRVLRHSGRLRISDVISGGALTEQEYRGLLLAAGLTAIRITSTQQAGAGLHSVIIQAARPVAPDGVLIRPMRPGDAGEVLAIYQAGLNTGEASFETAVPCRAGKRSMPPGSRCTARSPPTPLPVSCSAGPARRRSPAGLSMPG
jgi:SAM-dependent methyltransferase